MSKVFDVMALSLVFCVCCIPIVTIGPALTALYYSTVKSIRKDRSYPVKEFFHTFKRDFKQSFICGLIFIGIGLVLYFDIKYAASTSDTTIRNFRIFYLVILIILAFIGTYVFPLISRFTLKTGQLFKLAFYLSVRHLPSTLGCVAIIAASAILVYITMGFVLFILPASATLLMSFLMERVLKQTLERIGTGEDDNPDKWYEE